MDRYYSCNRCGYTFCAESEQESCIDCGKKDIRPAKKEEIEQYLKYREEFKDDKNEY